MCVAKAALKVLANWTLYIRFCNIARCQRSLVVCLLAEEAHDPNPRLDISNKMKHETNNISHRSLVGSVLAY